MESKEIQWLVSKSKLMIDSDGSTIPGSGIFKGTLPGRMADSLRDQLKVGGANYRSFPKSSCYNWKVGEVGYSLSYGATHSTKNSVIFTFCPDSW